MMSCRKLDKGAPFLLLQTSLAEGLIYQTQGTFTILIFQKLQSATFIGQVELVEDHFQVKHVLLLIL